MEQNVSTEKKSSEVIVVTSGKGGVGKTLHPQTSVQVLRRQAVKSVSLIRISVYVTWMWLWVWRTVSYTIW